jgi:hypothetical protein
MLSDKNNICSLYWKSGIHSTDMRDPAVPSGWNRKYPKQMYEHSANLLYSTIHFHIISYITSALLIYPSKTADWQSTELVTNKFSIFAQVNITNPTSWLVKFDVLSCYIHLQVNITKPKSSKWPPSRFVEVTDKEISEIKINSVPKNTKNLCKNTKTIIRLRLGDYRGIFTSTSSRWIFPDNHCTFGEQLLNIFNQRTFTQSTMNPGFASNVFKITYIDAF